MAQKIPAGSGMFVQPRADKQNETPNETKSNEHKLFTNLDPRLAQKLAELRLKEPTIRIGKNGISPGQLEEIIRQLRARELVKIKFLKSFLETNDRKEVAIELAEKTGSRLVLLTGFVVVLYKKKCRV